MPQGDADFVRTTFKHIHKMSIGIISLKCNRLLRIQPPGQSLVTMEKFIDTYKTDKRIKIVLVSTTEKKKAAIDHLIKRYAGVINVNDIESFLKGQNLIIRTHSELESKKTSIGSFSDSIVFIDEAHYFLNIRTKDDKDIYHVYAEIIRDAKRLKLLMVTDNPFRIGNLSAVQFTVGGKEIYDSWYNKTAEDDEMTRYIKYGYISFQVNYVHRPQKTGFADMLGNINIVYVHMAGDGVGELFNMYKERYDTIMSEIIDTELLALADQLYSQNCNLRSVLRMECSRADSLMEDYDDLVLKYTELQSSANYTSTLEDTITLYDNDENRDHWYHATKFTSIVKFLQKFNTPHKTLVVISRKNGLHILAHLLRMKDITVSVIETPSEIQNDITAFIDGNGSIGVLDADMYSAKTQKISFSGIARFVLADAPHSLPEYFQFYDPSISLESKQPEIVMFINVAQPRFYRKDDKLTWHAFRTPDMMFLERLISNMVTWYKDMDLLYKGAIERKPKR